MPRIAITNTTGGRNRGCEALVTSIVAGIEGVSPDRPATIGLHTGDIDYDRDFYRARIARYFTSTRRRFDRWTPGRQRSLYGAFRLIDRLTAHRLPIGGAVRDLLRADLIVATGGDIFTSDYGDFASHAAILNVGSPVALLAHTIGPLDAASEHVFRNSLRNVALCTVRESESLAYLRDIVPDLRVEQTADVAFLLPVTDAERARYIVEIEHHFPIAGRSLIALSISSGILAFRSDVDPEHYLREVAAFIDWLNDRGHAVVIVPHVQERAARNDDLVACRAVLARCRRPADNLLLGLPLSASDYKGVIGLCDALVGARTHATIASMSQGIPTASIAYSRKAWGIMRDYYGPELGTTLTVDVADMTRDRLIAAFEAAVANGRTEATATEMKRRAALNFTRLGALLGAR
jgi:colanic acid/amylovoran biosynthesis protein